MIDLAQTDSNGIPPSLSLTTPELSYSIWTRWMATGRRFLPSQLLQEPLALLDDVLTLDALYNALTRPTDGD